MYVHSPFSCESSSNSLPHLFCYTILVPLFLFVGPRIHVAALIQFKKHNNRNHFYNHIAQYRTTTVGHPPTHPHSSLNYGTAIQFSSSPLSLHSSLPSPPTWKTLPYNERRAWKVGFGFRFRLLCSMFSNIGSAFGAKPDRPTQISKNNSIM